MLMDMFPCSLKPLGEPHYNPTGFDWWPHRPAEPILAILYKASHLLPFSPISAVDQIRRVIVPGASQGWKLEVKNTN